LIKLFGIKKFWKKRIHGLFDGWHGNILNFSDGELTLLFNNEYDLDDFVICSVAKSDVCSINKILLPETLVDLIRAARVDGRKCLKISLKEYDQVG
jgi:hypothetical protein